MKRRQHRQDRPDRLADVEGMDGPGQRAMALSDVDSDSTCKQQRSSRQVGQKPPTANSQPERERERRCCALATKGRCTHARTTTLTRLTTLDSSTGWVHEYLVQHLPAAAHTLDSRSNRKESSQIHPYHITRRINGRFLRQHAHVTLV